MGAGCMITQATEITTLDGQVDMPRIQKEQNLRPAEEWFATNAQHA